MRCSKEEKKKEGGRKDVMLVATLTRVVVVSFIEKKKSEVRLEEKQLCVPVWVAGVSGDFRENS